MRRLTILAVVFAALAAAMALGASVAFAELPEILEGAPIQFEGTASKGEILTAKASLACERTKLTGEITSTGSGTAHIDLEGCKSKGLVCESLGEKVEGTVLEEASITLVTVELPSTKKLGLGVLVAPTSELHVECGAGTLLILYSKSIIGEFLNLTVEEHEKVLLSLFEVGKEYELSFETKESKQVITKCISPKAHCESEDLLLANFGKGVEDAGLLTTLKLKVTSVGGSTKKAHIDY